MNNSIFTACLFLFIISTSAMASEQSHPVVHTEGIGTEYVDPGNIIFKLIPEAVHENADSQLPAMLKNSLPSVLKSAPERIFPTHESPPDKRHPSGKPLTDLSRMYEVEISQEHDMEAVMTTIAATGLVEYVQPRYLPEQTLPLEAMHYPEGYVPNDTLLDEQYYLDNIEAFAAWGLFKGDTNTVIGIVDTGVELHHPDLVNAIKYNYDDPINGEDSDNDGYEDNFYGWDLGEGNNDPSYNKIAHGVHVSGIAAATADNVAGIAGTGFHSTFLPVKIDDEFGNLVKAYEGIVYAADQGVSVINCSWGSHFNAGPFGQDIINYATFNQDVLVVAAAGNADSPVPFYPASFEHVLSVAATDSLDRKAGFSSYGDFVDVTAPGVDVLSTWVNGSYINSNGTSMASPVVAGAAAIVRAYFPEHQALQVKGMLKMTTDSIDGVAGNEDYAGQLGHGRLNMYRALTETHWPYMAITGLLTPGETLEAVRPDQVFPLHFQYQNRLADAEDVTAVLTTSSEHLDAVNDSIFLGNVDSLQVVGHEDNPFLLMTDPALPVNHAVSFTVSFVDGYGNRIGKQTLNRRLHLDYVNIQAGNIATTISARGAIGFNYPYYSQGLGLTYKNSYTRLKSGGLIVGNSHFSIADNIYGAGPDAFSETLLPETLPEVHDDHPLASKQVSGSLTTIQDDRFDALEVDIAYQLYFWDEEPADDFFLLTWHITNQSQNEYHDFFAGFFADWVLRDNKYHRATLDVPGRLAYAFHENGGHYTGIQLLSAGGMRHYAFDNPGTHGSMQIDNGFSDFQKYTALTSNRYQSGFYYDDNDVASLLSSGPHTLGSGDSLSVTFAIHLTDNFQEMSDNLDKAVSYYQALQDIETHVISLEDADREAPFTVHPNPFTDYLQLTFSRELPADSRLSFYDLYGRLIEERHLSKTKNPGQTYSFYLPDLPSGMYILRLRGNGIDSALRVVKQ